MKSENGKLGKKKGTVKDRDQRGMSHNKEMETKEWEERYSWNEE
jgi:hypothetical protein